MVLDRAKLQELTRIRLREAHVLLANHRYDGAYYLAGYAVECALKACIARKTRRYDFPDKDVVSRSYTHDLNKLADAAGLGSILAKDIKTTPFGSNWAVVKDWKIESRYQTTSPQKARDLYAAITSHRGVLRWIRQHW